MSNHSLTQHRGRWSIRYTLDGKRSYASTGIPVGDETSRAQAQQYLNEWLRGQEKAVEIEKQETTGTTIGEICADYRDHLIKVERGFGTRFRAVHLIRHLGAYQPEALNRKIFDDYKEIRTTLDQRRVCENTAIAELRFLRTALAHAWENNPKFKGRDKPAIDESKEERAVASTARVIHLDDWEQGAYIEAAKTFSPFMHQFTMIALYTAARLESIRMLDWARIDWIAATVDFRYPGEIETRKKRVVVDIHDHLMPVLREMWLKQGRPRKGLVLYPGLFYPTNGRSSVERARLRRETYQALPRFGWDWTLFTRTTDRPDVTPHALRRSCAVRMFRGDATVGQVAMVLGDTEENVRLHYKPFIRGEGRRAINMMRSPEEMERDRRLMMGEDNVVAFGGGR